MYTRRIQIINYGPIDKLDIEFPFDGDRPKPIVLVGENGSGKSILLSHIVNGLIDAKGTAYPETPEVKLGKVYKLRSNSYIKSGGQYYFVRIDFDDGLFVEEMRLIKPKQEYEAMPAELSGLPDQDLWRRMKPESADNYVSRFSDEKNKIDNIFSKNCVLYFPPNRFEEPAWLNRENLKAQAQYMDLTHLQGQTDRRVINYSPLHHNQNWLFELIYDRSAFEIRTSSYSLNVKESSAPISIPVFFGYSGNATSIYETTLRVVRKILRKHDARFGIGTRKNRVVSLTSDLTGQIVPNIFQLSSGETSLLNLFLSVLRDFDLCGTPFSGEKDIRGIAVVDEVDLHLHANHQYEILPELISMFPNVQFVVTTHSSLFVLGMKKIFGEDGFALYRLPQGHHISSEEFSEFGNAYRAFTETSKFSSDIRTAIENAQRPIVFVEGTTDQRYIQKASQLLGQETMLERVEFRYGGGASNLGKIWNAFKPPLADIVPQKVVLLFDCDKQGDSTNRENLFRRNIPMQRNNPIQKGIENLFSRATLEEARQHKLAFIDVDPGRTKTVRGEPRSVSERWTVNEDEKANLCDWLCENGTEADFQAFRLIFELLEEVLDLYSGRSEGVSVAGHDSGEGLPDGSEASDLQGS